MTKRSRDELEQQDAETSMPEIAPIAKALVSGVEKSPTEILQHLLDMTHVPPGTEPSHFHSIATSLMQDFHLCIANEATPPVVSTYELLELEFYWYNEHTGHIDPFTHAAEEQRQSGNWYFHRAPRRAPPSSTSSAPIPSPKTSGFRGGTRKGLDLTFGSPISSDSETTAYGGILFRALRNTSTQKVTCGPSLLVDEVLRATGSKSLTELVGTVWKGDTGAFRDEASSRMFLRPVSTKPSKTAAIYTSPRIGLDLARIPTAADATPTHPRVQYVARPYRFFRHPQLLGSVRPQTFYGLLSLPRSQIADVLGMKPTQVETFAGHVADGRKVGKAGIKDFVGEKGKGAAPNVQRFLKMAGVLERLLDIGEDGGEGSAKKQKLGKTLTELFGSKGSV